MTSENLFYQFVQQSQLHPVDIVFFLLSILVGSFVVLLVKFAIRSSNRSREEFESVFRMHFSMPNIDIKKYKSINDHDEKNNYENRRNL